MKTLQLTANPNLVADGEAAPPWKRAGHRREGWRNLYQTGRYTTAFRARDILHLTHRHRWEIGDLDPVRYLTARDEFAGLCVLHGTTILYEKLASDFGPTAPHAIMSVTKTMASLLIGQLIADDRLDLDDTVARHLPEIGSGFAAATVRDVLMMNVANDYVRDHSDPTSSSFLQDDSVGLRLTPTPEPEVGLRELAASIQSSDIVNRSGFLQYKTINSTVLAWLAERCGVNLHAFLADMVDAAGFEGALYMITDRTGFPELGFGACCSLRDLVRYGALIARGGHGVHGETIGDPSFLASNLTAQGPGFPPPRERLRYSHHFVTEGRWLGHGGFGGQYLWVHPPSGLVVAHLGVVETPQGMDLSVPAHVIEAAETIMEMVDDASDDN